MGILSPAVQRPLAQHTVHHDAATAVGNGQEAYVAGTSAVALEVTGSFVASLVVMGRVDSAGVWHRLTVTTRDGRQDGQITAPGLYYVDVVGLAELRVRIDAYTSGQVTARSLSVPSSPPHETAPYAAVRTHSAAVSASTSAAVPVRGRTLATVDVSGTFTGRVFVRGFRALSETSVVLPLYDARGIPIPAMVAPGRAYADVSHMERVAVRVEPTDGEITVDLHLGPAPAAIVSPAPRHAEITRALNISVPGGGTEYLRFPGLTSTTLDLSHWAMIYVGVRTDVAHQWEVCDAPQATPPVTFSQSIYGERILLSSDAIRGVSEWHELILPRTQVFVRNNSDQPRRYDVFLYGIR